ncbi:Ferredoxin-2 protein [Thalictrum thalictroides]|uniref:Ferredoxin-2 protein n=1 Tax=Thalictrum thalictroides TaxID=46969 RepID=A0A7J6X2E2_THATH|nr:Ferredoxin-2 protein [Thalictrum thalictroides]
MLDLAFGLTETSRLGCQVIAKPELDGLRLALPAATCNFAVDGHVPKPHYEFVLYLLSVKDALIDLSFVACLMRYAVW